MKYLVIILLFLVSSCATIAPADMKYSKKLPNKVEANTHIKNCNAMTY